MTIPEYISQLQKRHKTGRSSEHTYRGDLEILIKTLCPEITVTNEPKRIGGNAPDFIITNGSIPVGYIEAKDIGVDLRNKKHEGQFDRYKKEFENLIITDYLTFQLFRDGIMVAIISIGHIAGNDIKGIPGNFGVLKEIITDFCNHKGQTIKSASMLASKMAGKARLLADVIEKALSSDTSGEITVHDTANNSLHSQYKAFKNVLIHDLTEKSFADVYAQTIAYGMFAARLHDPTPDTFTRHEAANLIPKSNPFLRRLFQYIAGYDLDDRIKWIVDALANIFRATDISELLRDFGKLTQRKDPIIHFYETFLTEYDKKLRKSRGVWYTPEPVVKFIVRAVDDILKQEFGLTQGLADISTTKLKVEHQGKQSEREEHKVQILDPAAGTGTFLAEVVKNIHQKFEGRQGMWSNYVEDHLIPRLHGFEILMASYAIAHLKLDLLLQETGYEPKTPKRFRVYLTNSLEEYYDTYDLFTEEISREANAAKQVKRDAPVMVVLGNPPYSGISSNKGKWITNLIEDYKYVDGEHFRERKHWLQDDYVKFIRYGQHFIDKNGEGILAFINNHSFLDNPTFRGMRWHLLQSFDKIYILDLHGNSKKKEVAPDGGKDENVFDIQQGVSINIFVKTGRKKKDELGKVYHADKFGLEEDKYSFLLENQLQSVNLTRLHPEKPYFFFVKKNLLDKEQYDIGFKVNDVFPLNNVGFVTSNDRLNISFSESEHRKKIQDLLRLSEDNWRVKYKRPKDAQSWKYKWAKHDADQNQNKSITKVSYRPFDNRYTLYTGKSGGLFARPIYQVMQHFLKGENVGLVIPKINKEDNSFLITKHIMGHKFCSAYDSNSVFPLYIYSEIDSQQHIYSSITRTPNLNLKIIDELAQKLGLHFTPEKKDSEGSFAPIDILDYIYAVLHTPTYRKKYKELLKIDFPKVPYPEDQEKFWQLVKLGSELRQIHLMESPKLEQHITRYPQNGSDLVDKLRYEIDDDATTGKVWINKEQYFDGVPKVAWEFFIGGYQPAQKWLKDRKGRPEGLSYEDKMHYGKIIVALLETDRLMKEIDHIDCC